jgi:large subunit ribosomal protein L32
MSVPKKRQTKGRSRRRRSHHALKAASPQKCPNCKKPIRAHYACPNCGYYNGKQKITPKKKTKK